MLMAMIVHMLILMAIDRGVIGPTRLSLDANNWSSLALPRFRSC